MLQLDARGDLDDLVCGKLAGSLLHASPAPDARGRGPGRHHPAPDPAADGRRLHPRTLVLAGSHDLPDPARDGLHLGPGPRRAWRSGRGRGDRRDRTALDLLAGPVHRPRPAVGTGRRDLRRGSPPDRRAGRGHDPRLPGRRPARPHRRARDRQALRRLLRDPGRPGRQRGRPHPAQAALLVPPTVRAGRRRRLPHLHARLPGDRRRPRHRQRVAAQRRPQAGVGLHRHAGHRLGQRRPHGLGTEGLRHRRRGGHRRRRRRERPDHDHAAVLRRRAGGGAPAATCSKPSSTTPSAAS